jgi:predicted transcriptional regulator
MKIKQFLGMFLALGIIILSAKSVNAQSATKVRNFYISTVGVLYQETDPNNKFYTTISKDYAFATVTISEKQTLVVNLYDQQKQLKTTQLYSISNKTKPQAITITDVAGRKSVKNYQVNEIKLLD